MSSESDDKTQPNYWMSSSQDQLINLPEHVRYAI